MLRPFSFINLRKLLLIGILSTLWPLTGCSHFTGRGGEVSNPVQGANDRLETVTTFEGAQVTGVTMSTEGRLFANFPRWREGVPFSVVEIYPDGSYRPYPDQDWNTWSGKPQKNQFTSVQSVLAHNGSLYVLDTSNPLFQGVLGRAKLFEFDLATNTLKRTYEFDNQVAPKDSYLNDLRVDDTNGSIYITDSGTGALVILNRKTGKSRRLLAQHPSTQSEDIDLMIEGKKFLIGGQAPDVHSDGIALSPDDKHLFYHALTGYTLYRVPTAVLNNPKASGRALTKKTLAKSVENLGKTPATDGMIFDQRGNLYMANIESNAIVYRMPTGEIRTLVQDERIKWADTFTIDEKNQMLLFTVSRLHETPVGVPIAGVQYPILKTPLAR